MKAYVPGEQPPAGAKVIKLNTNENPYPPSPQVAVAVRAELDAGTAAGERLRLYSDPGATLLRQAAAETTGLDLGNVIHGNGSDELLAMLFRAFVAEGELVAYPYPTYSLYDTLACAQGAQQQRVDFDDEFHLPAGLWGSAAKLVFIANPNAPSGTLHSIEQIESLARSLPQGLVVVDEAYVAFAHTDMLPLVRRLDNVVVLRTLSKSHSMAGMRVGLLYGPEQIISALWKVKDSYNLDRLAIVAGAASLRDAEWTAQNVERIRASRERLSRSLAELGLQVVPSQANFVFTRFASANAAEAAYRALREAGILVRYFPARLLDDGIRITVGTDEEIDALLSVLRKHLGR